MSNTSKSTSKSKARSGGRTTPPKERASVDEVTDGASWAQEGRAAHAGSPLKVPSGKTCLVRRPQGMKFFLDQGMIPNALLPIIMEAVNEHKQKTPKEVGDLVMADPEMLPQLMGMADSVVIHCVLQPKVHPVPTFGDEDELPDGAEVGDEVPPHLRPDDNKLYIDYIDEGDKMFIFNYAVSGVTDVDQFRSELAESVASL